MVFRKLIDLTRRAVLLKKINLNGESLKQSERTERIKKEQFNINFLQRCNKPEFKQELLTAVQKDHYNVRWLLPVMYKITSTSWPLGSITGLLAMAIFTAVILYQTLDPEGIKHILAEQLNIVLTDRRVLGTFGYSFNIHSDRTHGYSGVFSKLPKKLMYVFNGIEYMKMELDITSTLGDGRIFMYLKRDDDQHWECFYTRVDVLPPRESPGIVLTDHRDWTETRNNGNLLVRET